MHKSRQALEEIFIFQVSVTELSLMHYVIVTVPCMNADLNYHYAVPSAANCGEFMQTAWIYSKFSEDCVILH